MAPRTPLPHWFKPGQSGNPGGGRTKNLVKETLKSNGKNPIAEILALIPELKVDKRADVWLTLLSYLQGKPKEVDTVLSNEELLELLEERFPVEQKEVG